MPEAGGMIPDTRRLVDAGRRLLGSGRPDAAILEFDKALATALRTERAAIHHLMGLCFLSLNELDRAEAGFRVSLKLAREEGVDGQRAAALSGLGAVCRAREQPDAALEFYEEALGIYQLGDYHSGMAMELGNIAEVYQSKGDLEQAVRYFLGALGIHTGREPVFRTGCGWQSLARLFAAMGRDRFLAVCAGYGYSLSVAETLVSRISNES